MKFFQVSGVLICLLVSGTLGVHVPAVAKQQHSYISEVSSVSGKVGDDDKCSLCIEFAGQAINGLLQMVLRKYNAHIIHGYHSVPAFLTYNALR
jgi:hypothetical protein